MKKFRAMSSQKNGQGTTGEERVLSWLTADTRRAITKVTKSVCACREKGGMFVVISRVTDVRKHGIERPTYLPTRGQPSSRRDLSYLPTLPVTRSCELCNVKKDQTL